MALLGTEILTGDRGFVESEIRNEVETYVFLFNNSGNIFLSGSRKTGYDTIHGQVDPKASMGEWIIEGLQGLGLSESDLAGLNVFPEIHKTEFRKRKVEVVGILCDSVIVRKLENNIKESGFIAPSILANRNYKHFTPNGLGELADQLSDENVIDRPEIFVAEK